MKLDEMRQCAAETLAFFIQVMPNAPFGVDDIVFEFAKQSEMARRAVNLCAMYCPEKVFNDSQRHQLNTSIAGNAFVGREKSAVLFCINTRTSKKDFRRIVFHELMHIFCGKLEMEGEHFIDIYGSGTTPDSDTEDKTYDGMIVAGYVVWTEFIAQYYAIKMIDKPTYSFSEIAEYVNHFFHDVNMNDLEGSKGSFSMICAYWINAIDLAKTLETLKMPGTFLPSDEAYGEETQNALWVCIEHICEQMKQEHPWKICEEFIHDLGVKFNMFRVMNSFYLSN